MDVDRRAAGRGDGLERGGAAVKGAEVVVLVDGDGDDAAVGLVVEQAPYNLPSPLIDAIRLRLRMRKMWIASRS